MLLIGKPCRHSYKISVVDRLGKRLSLLFIVVVVGTGCSATSCQLLLTTVNYPSITHLRALVTHSYHTQTFALM